MADLTRTSSIPPCEQQQLEVELLQSIYGEAAFHAAMTVENEQRLLRIRLPPEAPENQWRVELQATLPKEYPLVLPHLKVSVKPSGDPTEHSELLVSRQWPRR